MVSLDKMILDEYTKWRNNTNQNQTETKKTNLNIMPMKCTDIINQRLQWDYIDQQKNVIKDDWLCWRDACMPCVCYLGWMRIRFEILLNDIICIEFFVIIDGTLSCHLTLWQIYEDEIESTSNRGHKNNYGFS